MPCPSCDRDDGVIALDDSVFIGVCHVHCKAWPLTGLNLCPSVKRLSYRERQYLKFGYRLIPLPQEAGVPLLFTRPHDFARQGVTPMYDNAESWTNARTNGHLETPVFDRVCPGSEWTRHQSPRPHKVQRALPVVFAGRNVEQLELF